MEESSFWDFTDLYEALARSTAPALAAHMSAALTLSLASPCLARWTPFEHAFLVACCVGIVKFGSARAPLLLVLFPNPTLKSGNETAILSMPWVDPPHHIY